MFNELWADNRNCIDLSTKLGLIPSPKNDWGIVETWPSSPAVRPVHLSGMMMMMIYSNSKSSSSSSSDANSSSSSSSCVGSFKVATDTAYVGSCCVRDDAHTCAWTPEIFKAFVSFHKNIRPKQKWHTCQVYLHLSMIDLN